MIYLDANNLYAYVMKFLPTSRTTWIDPKEFDFNKYPGNSLKGCAPEVDFEVPIKLHKMHNNYPITTDEIEIKREILSNYQLKIADFYNIPIGNVKKLVPNLFNQEKYVLETKKTRKKID